ncbi:dan [Symbiodinium sp. CCMP2456]|nr:dan [Symbiodinium sp. CCMP2456]
MSIGDADFVIRAGRVIDGTGKPEFVADIAVKDGVISAIGQNLPVQGRQEFDARGLLVTPGWVDGHTHYDAQWSWDPYLSPSSSCGVTTCIMGNCGIGFAPCQKDRRKFLAHLVEAVEDVPERIIAEGLTYDFETFEEYMDSLDRATLACDVAVLVGHSAVRAWVMGDRANLSDKPGGAAEHPLKDHEIEAIAALVRDAVAVGACGFSTSRLLMHRDPEGTLTPGTLSCADELKAIAQAIADGGGGVFEMSSDFLSYDDVHHENLDPKKLRAYQRGEYEWLIDIARRHGRDVPVTFNCFANHPTLFVIQSINDAGGLARGQCIARAQGLLQSFHSRAHPFVISRTFNAILKHCQEGGLDLIDTLRRSGKREKIIAETTAFFSSDQAGQYKYLQDFFKPFDEHFPWTSHYEPEKATDSVVAIAQKEGRGFAEVYWDIMINGGVVWKPFLGSYDWGGYNMTCTMLNHPHIMPGFADAGAHGTIFQDAAIASHMLCYLARDRVKGPKMSLEHVVKLNSLEVASFFGLKDRGALQVGMKADINVIDFERLSMGQPYIARDMPLGQDRWLQDVEGYCLTLLSGRPTLMHGRLTGALPGRLLRNPRRNAAAYQGSLAALFSGLGVRRVSRRLAEGVQHNRSIDYSAAQLAGVRDAPMVSEMALRLLSQGMEFSDLISLDAIPGMERAVCTALLEILKEPGVPSDVAEAALTSEVGRRLAEQAESVAEGEAKRKVVAPDSKSSVSKDANLPVYVCEGISGSHQKMEIKKGL